MCLSLKDIFILLNVLLKKNRHDSQHIYSACLRSMFSFPKKFNQYLTQFSGLHIQVNRNKVSILSG